MWEDDQNKNGGRWVINLQKSFRNNDLDDLWLDVILCLIGEAFDYSEDICGAVVNIRPRGPKMGMLKAILYLHLLPEHDRTGRFLKFHFMLSSAAVWTSNNDKTRILSIGERLKESLNLPKEMLISYELHKESAFKHGGKAAAYTL